MNEETEMGLFDNLRDAALKSAEFSKRAKEKESLRSQIVPLIKVSTSSIQQKYSVIDAVFAIDIHRESIFNSGANPRKAFDRVIDQLRNTCFDLGGDAVINCQFEYRETVDKGVLGGNKQGFQIFAYGTAVSIDE
jgi:hypothetical protein